MLVKQPVRLPNARTVLIRDELAPWGVVVMRRRVLKRRTGFNVVRESDEGKDIRGVFVVSSCLE